LKQERKMAKKKYFYHIVANIDTEFDSVDECLAAYTQGDKKTPSPFYPWIPVTRLADEDTCTRRIPVGQSIEDCITALSTGRFRRCLAANYDAKTYHETLDEAYPILVCRFDGNTPVYEPDKSQVPDVEKTHELWIMEPTYPVDIQIKWLDSYSILCDVNDMDSCQKVRFVSTRELRAHVHPWLTGTGNILESSLMDYQWAESKYRTPWTVLDRNIAIALAKGGASKADIQVKEFGYRSKAEIEDVIFNTEGLSLYSAELKLTIGSFRREDPINSQNFLTSVDRIFDDTKLSVFFCGEKKYRFIGAYTMQYTLKLHNIAEKDQKSAERFVVSLGRALCPGLRQLGVELRRITVKAEESEK